MNKLLRHLLLAAGLALGGLAQAAGIAGVQFNDRMQVGGAELVLNGVGVRQVAWLQGYAAGLYLPHKATAAPEVLAMPGPKRLRLRLLVDVEAKEFAKAIDKGMRRNHSAAELDVMKPRIARFDALVLTLGALRKGDVIDLDFLPGTGVVLQRNGKPEGTPQPGDDLSAGLVKIFIGEVPVDTALKAGLLGRP